MNTPYRSPAPAPPDMPVRYRTTPLLALIALACVPAIALGALFVWSDREADAHETQSQEVPSAPVPGAPPAPELTTAMADFRRAPSTLTTLANDNELAAAMEQLYAFVDDRSCVSVAVDDRLVSARNDDVRVIPASTLKVLVAGVAIETLTPEYVFTTDLVAPPAVEGVIDGDVFLVGGGDPVLSAFDFPFEEGELPAVITPLEALADGVVAAGVTTIRGAVVGDASRYDDVTTNPAWGPGVALVDAGPIAGLVANDGRAVGRFGRQEDAGEAAARELVRLLRDRGVQVFNGSGSGVSPSDGPVLASATSPPLADIVADMLTRSDNDTAEMLVKEIGLVAGDGGTTEAGLDVIGSSVASWGVPTEGMVLVDGSGLSATNRLTCDTLLGVLQHLRGTDAIAGLPVAGRTGTLVFDLVGTTVEGSLAAKTGTLANPPPDEDPPEVKALAGYLPVDNGETISFVIVLNGPGYVTAEGYVPYWGALAERIDAYPAGTDPALFGPR
jgi:D-alanyl-D-alanine carboxypeptidase/D-alanyl-D-alanine-endopeptidase (penicillin-binding protein 4)